MAAGAFAYDRYDTKTLKRTIRRDAVYCGVNTGLPGFSSADAQANWSGFDVDFCRAIAAAIFDDPSFPKMHFIEHNYTGDPTNWWAPNRACAEALLRSSGFRIEAHPEAEVFICRVDQGAYLHPLP